MSRPLPSIGLIALLLLTGVALAVEPERIDIREIIKFEASLIGKPISTHGCLVFTPHGQFIQFCGSNDWHEDIVLVSDPGYRVSAAFKAVGVDYSHMVEGDFSGVIVEIPDEKRKSGKGLFFRLDSVVNAIPYRS